MELGMDMTMREMVAAMKDDPAIGTMKIVIKDSNQSPVAAIIAVAGKSETYEILQAVEEVEEDWN